MPKLLYAFSVVYTTLLWAAHHFLPCGEPLHQSPAGHPLPTWHQHLCKLAPLLGSTTCPRLMRPTLTKHASHRQPEPSSADTRHSPFSPQDFGQTLNHPLNCPLPGWHPASCPKALPCTHLLPGKHRHSHTPLPCLVLSSVGPELPALCHRAPHLVHHLVLLDSSLLLELL